MLEPKGHQQIYDSSVALTLTFLRRGRCETERNVRVATLATGVNLAAAVGCGFGSRIRALGKTDEEESSGNGIASCQTPQPGHRRRQGARASRRACIASGGEG